MSDAMTQEKVCPVCPHPVDRSAAMRPATAPWVAPAWWRELGKVHLGEFGWSECGLQGDPEDPLGASYETT